MSAKPFPKKERLFPTTSSVPLAASPLRKMGKTEAIPPQNCSRHPPGFLRHSRPDSPASRMAFAGLVASLFFLALRKHLRKGHLMIQRITKTLLILLMLIGLAYAGPSVCLGWSLNPFASNDKAKTTTVSRTTQKPPSAWQKVTTGTKNFFNKTGETLGLKKKQPKKAPPVVAAKPRTLQPKAKEGGMFSFLSPEKKPKDVKDWLGKSEQITP